VTTSDPGPREGVNAPGDAAELTEKRRQLVSLSLERRPSLTLDRLRAVLVSFNLDADDETLVADLDSIGYDIADGTVIRRGDREYAGEERDDIHEDDEPQRGALGSRSREAAIAAAVLVAVIVIGLVLLLPRDDGGTDLAADGTTEPTAKQDTPVAPAGPGSDPKLAAATDRDDFNRPDGPLGDDWVPVRGTWSIVNGEATVERGDEQLTLATFELGTSDVRAQVTVPNASKASGLAFRIVDDANYWLWTIAPDFATFTLTRVEDGKPTVIGNSGITITRPGATLGINATGTTVELLANGAVVKKVEDDTAAPGTQIGLATIGAGPTATFDDLIFQRGP
jgi:hypothetical protein